MSNTHGLLINKQDYYLIVPMGISWFTIYSKFVMPPFALKRFWLRRQSVLNTSRNVDLSSGWPLSTWLRSIALTPLHSLQYRALRQWVQSLGLVLSIVIRNNKSQSVLFEWHNFVKKFRLIAVILFNLNCVIFCCQKVTVSWQKNMSLHR